jgi:hypothetical protein
MDWQRKALAFRVLSALPFGDALHYQLQRRVTRSLPRNEGSLVQRVEEARWIIEEFERNGGQRAAATFLELGAGRDLTVPLAMRLLGVERVITTDIQRLAKLDLVQDAANRVARQLGRKAPEIRAWRDLLVFGIDYRAPARIAAVGDLIDCFFSVVTLEHLPPEAIREELLAARNILRSRGQAIHIIDYSDHFAHIDHRLSPVNFLQYSDSEWRRFNSRFQYVNRLRHSQYLAIFEKAGYRILAESSRGAGPLPTSIAPEFASFAADELAAVEGRISAAPILF